jgi:hypothetical protein
MARPTISMPARAMAATLAVLVATLPAARVGAQTPAPEREPDHPPIATPVAPEAEPFVDDSLPPPVAQERPVVYSDAVHDAARNDALVDAEAEVNVALWFAAGCMLNVFGVLIAYAVEPSPSGARIIGRDPAYVSTYVTTYRNHASSLQGRSAVYGCVSLVLFEAALVFWINAVEH